MRRLYLVLLAVALLSFTAIPIVTFTGCKTSQQEIAYKTLYTLEVTTTATYDAYLTSVVKGKVSTDGVKAVSQAYNDFQRAMQIAVDQVKGNVQAPADPTVQAASSKLINLIAQAK